MKHAAVAMDIEGNHKLIPLDEDVSTLIPAMMIFPHLYLSTRRAITLPLASVAVSALMTNYKTVTVKFLRCNIT